MLFEPGIYFGLDEGAYHDDLAKGSTDIRSLIRGAKLDIDTDATVVGSAMHKLVLEGRAAFDRVYVRRPDDPPSATSSEKGKLTKEWNLKLFVGQELLHGEVYDLILDVAAIVNAHPDLKGSFDGAEREVSVFWERDGIRMKARFDLLKPRGMGDLKSIANEMGDPLDVACDRRFWAHKHYVQGEHYMNGRAAMPALIEQKKVFEFVNGKQLSVEPNTKRSVLLAKLAKETRYDFIFIYMPKNGARTAWGLVYLQDNEDLRNIARGEIEAALAVYREDPKGFDEAANWARILPIRAATLDTAPYWIGKR